MSNAPALSSLSPAEIDTALAAKWNALVARLDKATDSVRYSAGARRYGVSRTRAEWTMTVAEATEKVEAELAAMLAAGERSKVVGGMWRSTDDLRGALDRLVAARDAVAAKRAEIDELNSQYTGWSRFFLVTSSKGHIHSSMSCSTCRPTTTYGWLPELSGQTEAEAVAAHGPALCSVCYPSAPVDWVGGWITEAQAKKKAA